MFSKKTKLTALICAGLMLFQTFTIQATPTRNEEVFMEDYVELQGMIKCNENADGSSTLVNVDTPNEKIKVPSNTPITLRTTKNISAKEVKKGADIDLRVVYDVRVDGKIVIPAGAIAKGKVSFAQKPKMWGKPGKIEIVVEELRMNDTVISLNSAPYTEEGESRATSAWIWFGVSLIILWPCIFVPFFLKGRDAVISIGTTIDAYTSKTELLEPVL